MQISESAVLVRHLVVVSKLLLVVNVTVPKR